MNNSVTPELLSRLLAEHGAALTLFARQWTTAPEDCVQEALWQLVRQPVVPERVVPWLYRVVRNQAITAQRARQRRERHESAAASERLNWFQADKDDAIDGERLSEVLRTLPDDHREIVLARIWGGLSFEQIADVVGTSRSSAHRYYEEGLRILRERLGVACLDFTKPVN